MPLEEYRLNDAWRMVEESIKTGKPLKESKHSGSGKAMRATTNPNENEPDGYDEYRNEGRMEEEVGMTTSGPSNGSPVDAADPHRDQGIARFAKKLEKKKPKKRVQERMGMGASAGAPNVNGAMMASDEDPMDPASMGMGMGAGMGMDSTSAVSDIIERLKQRFPSADIKVAVQLPSGATFADAEIEAALDAVEGGGQMGFGDEEGEEEDSDDEEEDSDDDSSDNAGADAVEFSNTPDDDDEDEDYDDEEDDTADDDGEEEELEENGILDGARKPKQGPDQYLHNKGISESVDRKDDEGDSGEGIEPCCFTMTIDQWESFLNSDPFKRM